jgi:hypothetical protein
MKKIIMMKIILCLFCFSYGFLHGTLADRASAYQKNIVCIQDAKIPNNGLEITTLLLFKKICKKIDLIESFSGESFSRLEYNRFLHDIDDIIFAFPSVMLYEYAGETVLTYAVKSMNPDLMKLVLSTLNKDIFKDTKDVLLNAPLSNGRVLIDYFLESADINNPVLIKIFVQLVQAGLRVPQKDYVLKLNNLGIYYE